jgi:type VI protein secretion system component VasF
MEALAAKADVKARLKESAGQAKERMREQAAQTVARVRGQAARGAGMARTQAYDKGELVRRNPVPWAAIAAGAVATVVVLMIVRGRRR